MNDEKYIITSIFKKSNLFLNKGCKIKPIYIVLKVKYYFKNFPFFFSNSSLIFFYML